MATLDTHTIIKQLISSGVKEKEAEIWVANFVSKSEFLEAEKDKRVLATKSDIDIIKGEINNIKENMATKTDVVEIKTDLKWLKAAIVGIFGLLLKIAFFTS